MMRRRGWKAAAVLSACLLVFLAGCQSGDGGDNQLGADDDGSYAGLFVGVPQGCTADVYAVCDMMTGEVVAVREKTEPIQYSGIVFASVNASGTKLAYETRQGRNQTAIVVEDLASGETVLFGEDDLRTGQWQEALGPVLICDGEKLLYTRTNYNNGHWTYELVLHDFVKDEETVVDSGQKIYPQALRWERTELIHIYDQFGLPVDTHEGDEIDISFGRVVYNEKTEQVFYLKFLNSKEELETELGGTVTHDILATEIWRYDLASGKAERYYRSPQDQNIANLDISQEKGTLLLNMISPDYSNYLAELPLAEELADREPVLLIETNEDRPNFNDVFYLSDGRISFVVTISDQLNRDTYRYVYDPEDQTEILMGWDYEHGPDSFLYMTRVYH